MSSVDWCKAYERLAIRFAEKLARLSSKINNIHDTRNEVFHKDLFNKCEQIRSFMRICLYLLKKLLTEKSIFCALICASK